VNIHWPTLLPEVGTQNEPHHCSDRCFRAMAIPLAAFVPAVNFVCGQALGGVCGEDHRYPHCSPVRHTAERCLHRDQYKRWGDMQGSRFIRGAPATAAPAAGSERGAPSTGASRCWRTARGTSSPAAADSNGEMQRCGRMMSVTVSLCTRMRRVQDMHAHIRSAVRRLCLDMS